jgi:hypothetical protein
MYIRFKFICRLQEYVPEHKGKQKKENQAKNKVATSKGKGSAKKPKRMISSDESSEDEKEHDDSNKKNKHTKVFKDSVYSLHNLLVTG